MFRRQSVVSGETCPRGDEGRSQSLHSTEAVKAVRGAESKTALREGRQEGGSVKDGAQQIPAPGVSVRATQGAETHDRDWSWVEATVWTERMLSALGNGVKGNKWFSLMDKTIYAGQMYSSRELDCSPCIRCGSARDNPDEETPDWRAVCGKTARTVRGEGRAKALLYPYQSRKPPWVPACARTTMHFAARNAVQLVPC